MTPEPWNNVGASNAKEAQLIARVARFAGQPDRFTTGEYRWVLETVSECDGFVAAYHLVDEAGDSISFSIFESETAARTAEERVGLARERLGRKASPPDEIGLWRIVDSASR